MSPGDAREEARQPRFRHDCSKCTYLGCFEASDLYHCLQATGPTVIRRYGDDGPSYTSGIAIADHDPGLREAVHRARERGLVVAIGVH